MARLSVEIWHAPILLPQIAVGLYLAIYLQTNKMVSGKMESNLVMVSFGPEKLGPGRNIPAATSLVVSRPNLSAIKLTRAFGYVSCKWRAVEKPTTPAPITAKLISAANKEYLFCSTSLSLNKYTFQSALFNWCCFPDGTINRTVISSLFGVLFVCQLRCKIAHTNASSFWHFYW